MRAIGVDYGEKRIGLSYGDELGVAVSLPAATEPKKADRIAQIERIAKERDATDIVIGLPLNMDGSVGFKAREAEAFAAELEKRLGLPVHRIDERLTTHQALEERKARGRLSPKKQRVERKSGDIDSRAAQIILQDFLDQRLPPPGPFGEL